MASRRADVMKMVAAAQRYGCAVRLLGNGHILVSKGDQREPLSTSPGGGGSMKQVEARMRKKDLLPPINDKD